MIIGTFIIFWLLIVIVKLIKFINFKNDLSSNNDAVILETVKLNSEEVDGEEECSICLENYNKEDNIIKLKCNHQFHFKCINCWIEKNECCPICRSTLLVKKPENDTFLINMQLFTIIIFKKNKFKYNEKKFK